MLTSGRTALVTGAGKRVGRAIALALAGAGADVYVHYGRSREAAEDTARVARDLGVRAWTGSADLADSASIARLFEDVALQAGRLDVLVNSAARFDKQPLDAIEASDWSRSFDVNLRAPFLSARHAAALMKQSGEVDRGCIVNISDLSGVHPWRDYVQHGLSKAGVLHLTKILARELAPEVRVNTIVPGAILPPPGMSEDDPEWRETAQRVPLLRTGHADQIADTVLYLVGADFTTGATIHVDGGEGLLGPVGH
jgi:NAD(P)-dependent dehydrogenase (short-subunit alcohol dehydrogenase family)